MKITARANQTYANSCGHVLFIKGREYEVTGAFAAGVFVRNELNTETVVRFRQLPTFFIVSDGFADTRESNLKDCIAAMC